MNSIEQYFTLCCKALNVFLLGGDRVKYNRIPWTGHLWNAMTDFYFRLFWKKKKHLTAFCHFIGKCQEDFKQNIVNLTENFGQRSFKTFWNQKEKRKLSPQTIWPVFNVNAPVENFVLWQISIPSLFLKEIRCFLVTVRKKKSRKKIRF